MAPITNQGIIDQFKKAAAVLSVIDSNFFRVRAYQTAIESIENLDEEISSLVMHQDIEEIHGIGKELADKINELITTGKSQELERLFSKVPQGMFPLLDVPSLGPKKSFQLATEFDLHLDNQSALIKVKKLAQAHKISSLPGWGETSEAKLLENLDRLKPKSERMRLDQADTLAKSVKSILDGISGVERVEILGSLRRRKDTIGDVDLAISANDYRRVTRQLKQHPDVLKLAVSGENVIRLVLRGNKQVDVKFQTPDKFGATLQHFTGSKSHNIALRELALSQGKSLSEHGIKQSGRLITFADETAFYQDLQLPFIPPELRENTGEIEAGHQNRLPELVTLPEVKGDFHTHTDFNMISSHDRGESIPALLSKAHRLGYQWLALGDHNPSQSAYSTDRLIEQILLRNKYIQQQYLMWKKTVKNSNLNIFSSMEVDILPDGTLALPPAALAKLDFIIISIHSQFTLNSKQQSDRILKAMDYPKVKIIGHPTGRIILNRSPITVDWEKIFNKCATKRIALEINANPKRLDLPDSLIKAAIKLRCQCALGSDAHLATHLEYLNLSVDTARRGWATKSDILNTLGYGKIINWLSS